jgi:hypothetical protein
MEPSEAADQIRETAEREGARAEVDRFRSRAAVVIAVLAMLLAIASMGGGNAAKEMTNSNIRASDTWAFYQAKAMRQTAFKLAADELEAQLAIHGDGLPETARKAVRGKIDAYRQSVARYDDEPDPQSPHDPLRGEGKKQLKARAAQFEEERDRAMRRDPNFDLSEALCQIAIVLGSVAILSLRRWVLGLSVGLGIVALVLMINGFLLLV